MPDDTRRVIPEIVIPGRRLGRNVNHDSRSMLFRVHAQPARALVSVTHERRVPVFDQGDLGSCTGNAAVGAVGTAPLFDGLPRHSSQPRRAARGQGVLGRHGAGRCTRHVPTDRHRQRRPQRGEGLKNLGLISGYLHATDVTTMQTALQDTPVIVGVNWYEGFDNPDHNGLVSISGQVRGGHEFEVVGLDLEKKLFLAVNSWGPGWGVNGHFSFSFDTMAQLLSEQGDCTQLLPLTVPAPVPAPADSDLAAWWADTKDWVAAPHGYHNTTQAAQAAKKLAASKGLT